MKSMLKTKYEVESWLGEYEVKNYTINDDLTVDVNGDVNLYKKNLKRIPIKFNHVNGNFYCSYNKLKNLIFAPKSILFDFDCGNNELTTLMGAPERVNGFFTCQDNNLRSLRYCPKYVGRYFSCRSNKIEKLDYFPTEVILDFYIDGNKDLGDLQKIYDFNILLNEHKSCVIRKFKKELDKGLDKKIDDSSSKFKI